MENKFNTFILIWQDFSFNPGLPGPGLTLIGLTRLKGFSPKREQRLWKLFQISGRDFKVRAKMTIENF